MARASFAITNFTAGELSPQLDGRTDLGKYFNGAKTLENFTVFPHGGAARRPGTRFAHEVKNSANKTRLIPFEFSTTDTYIMEFSNQKIRFYRDGGIITETGKTITGITQANPGVVTASSHGFSNGDDVIISGVVGMTQVNGITFKVANKTTNTFELQNYDGTNINTSAYTAYASGGTASRIYEIASPYVTADIPNVKFAQSADVMYLAHPTYAPRKLSRTAHTNWTLATPSFTSNPFGSTDNFPSCVTFYEQRLVFANTNNDPQKIFFSKTTDIEDFTVGSNAADGMTYAIASNKVNAIRYLTQTRSLIVGTVGGEFSVTASSSSEPITPTNIQIKKQSSYGSSEVDAVPIGNATMFLQRAKRKVRELVYNYDTDGFIAPDLTILAEHITDSGITEMSYMQEPSSILWCVREDGQVCGLTYQRNEQVVGWHRHIFGGVFGSGNAVVESVATIPGDLNEDVTYFIVKRTINGATRRYVEYLQPFDYGSDLSDAFFVDSGLVYSGGATTTLTGLGHLEGQSVTILADGSSHPNKTVSDGSITLDRSATKVQVGLSYNSTLQTMRLEAGSQDGTAQGKIKRIHNLSVRLFETVGLLVGKDTSNLDRVPFRSSAADMDTAVPLFTGDKEIEFNADYDNDGFIVIQQNQPLPMNVIALFPQFTTYDG
tara:strand:+ start:7344 stop:9332 length:1989 start_codon:yes stop_codon:yes gene_type:complete